jgi:hypothetical protein
MFFTKLGSNQIDSNYTNETSGCTAIVALITKDNTLYVVCYILSSEKRHH